jgi:hypothetical protein
VMCTGLVWLSTGTSEFGIEPSLSIKCWGNYRVSKELGISRIVLSSKELILVSYEYILYDVEHQVGSFDIKIYFFLTFELKLM